MTTAQEDIKSRLAMIAAKNDGLLTTTDVIADAEDDDSPLHSHFEWDDSVAARSYRVEQARVLIRSVKIDVTITTTTIAAPYYVRDTRSDQGYVALSQVSRRAGLARSVMREEMGRVMAAMERAMSVAVELGLEVEVEQLIVAIEQVRERALRAVA